MFNKGTDAIVQYVCQNALRLCPCADNDAISHLNYGLISPRQSNILYFGFPLCYLSSPCEAILVSVTLCDL